jgi:hypothetical protein
MESSWIALVLITGLATAGSGCSTRLFHDDLEADVVGAAPVSPPPGDPEDDSLSVGGPAGSVTVIDSAPLGSKAARIQRGGSSPAVTLECVTGGGPHNSGNYWISYRAYSPDLAVPPVTAAIVSATGQRAFELAGASGEFRLSSGEAVDAVVGAYAANAVHEILVRIDLDADRFWLSIGGTEVASSKPFLDGGFADLRALRFSYTVPILEALPAAYVVDNVLIRK